MDFATRKRSGKSSPGWALAIVLVLLGMGILAGLEYTGTIHVGSVSPATTTSQGGLVSSTLPLSISNTDPMARALITSNAAITFYTTSGSFIATCSTGSAGNCVTTGTSFTSGQNLIVNIVTGAGYITEWVPITVPYVPSGAAGITAIPVSLYQLANYSYTTTFLVGTTQVGVNTTKVNPFSYKYNFTSAASQGVTVSLSYKVANTGQLGCNQGTGLQYDIINKICQSAVLQISDTSTSLSVTGMKRQFSSGSTRYWWAIVPSGACLQSASNNGMGGLGQCGTPGAYGQSGTSDSNTAGSLTEQTIGNNLYGGTATVNLAVQQGSLVKTTPASYENLTFTLFVNADPNYFPINNNLGPNAVNATTPFTISFQAS